MIIFRNRFTIYTLEKHDKQIFFTYKLNINN